MNGLFNMNFMMTFLLAKDLPETRDKFLMAMSAGQSSNLLAPVLLKVGAIDKLTDLTQENTNLKSELASLVQARTDLDACQVELKACKAALEACKAGSGLDLCQKNLDACEKALKDCQAQLADAKNSGINEAISKVRLKKTVQELKDDDKLLGEILALANRKIPSAK